jgi:hypothetical protein
VPNVLRHFLAMTARVPITHVADTAQSPHQARQLSLPASKRHRPHHAPSPPAHTHPVDPPGSTPPPQTGQRRPHRTIVRQRIDASQPTGTAVSARRAVIKGFPHRRQSRPRPLRPQRGRIFMHHQRSPELPLLPQSVRHSVTAHSRCPCAVGRPQKQSHGAFDITTAARSQSYFMGAAAIRTAHR